MECLLSRRLFNAKVLKSSFATATSCNRHCPIPVLSASSMSGRISFFGWGIVLHIVAGSEFSSRHRHRRFVDSFARRTCRILRSISGNKDFTHHFDGFCSVVSMSEKLGGVGWRCCGRAGPILLALCGLRLG
jgi:hypothetical protein